MYCRIVWNWTKGEANDDGLNTTTFSNGNYIVTDQKENNLETLTLTKIVKVLRSTLEEFASHALHIPTPKIS